MEGQLQVAKVPFGTHGPRNSTEGDTIPETFRNCTKKPKTQFDLDGVKSISDAIRTHGPKKFKATSQIVLRGGSRTIKKKVMK